MAFAPSLAPQAFQLGSNHIRNNMQDTSLYQHLIMAYEQTVTAAPELELPSSDTLASYDARWVEEKARANAEERLKLEGEVKTYTSNMIKESIRMAHRDLAEFYRSIGDYQASLKHFAKMREYCTSSQHVLDMCLSVLEVLLEQQNWAHVPTYVFKAEPALDAATSSLRNSNQGPTATAPPLGRERIAAERQKTQSKLDLATALSQMGSGTYDKAASTFLRIGSARALGDWTSKIAAPSDIAIYGVLCALATFSRPSIKAQVLDNDSFSQYIEQEPYIRELVEAYMGSRFNTVLELLERYSTRHSLDLYLGPHVTALMNKIKNRALVLYFQPFASIRMDRMARAFGWSVAQLEEQVVTLIQAGEIEARVDRQNKTLKAKETDQRAQLFERAMKAGREMTAANRRLLLRMHLTQADLVIRTPKERTQASATTTAPSDTVS
ncbi:hypothetical protein EIP86_009378 [Pleurotus ostreatoroseus]|nr:hypothetical protein EIP86_009378 [Pleurotus ostreatoroseus]